MRVRVELVEVLERCITRQFLHKAPNDCESVVGRIVGGLMIVVA